jgi:outer membrane biosynthesis protein TonB
VSSRWITILAISLLACRDREIQPLTTTTDLQPARPAASTEIAPDGPFEISGDVTAPKPIGDTSTAPNIRYPKAPYRIGVLIVRMVVTKEGTVRNVEVLKGPSGGYADQFVEQMKRMRFQPGLRRGHPVDVIYHMTVNHVPYPSAAAN